MRWIALFTFVGLGLASAGAQSKLDDIEAAIDTRSNELLRAEQLLADPDPNRRMAAMEALLRSGDEALEAKAKEVGLFSGDPQLRSAAVRAILNEGGAFRAEFNIPANTDNITDIYEWLRRFKGSWSQDMRTGYFSFVIGNYDEAESCWKWLNSRNCALRMSGEEVLTADWDFNITGVAAMRLDATGALQGSFLVNGSGVPVEIRIPLLN